VVVIEHMNPFKPEEAKESRDDDEIDYLNSVIIQEVSYYLDLKIYIFIIYVAIYYYVDGYLIIISLGFFR